MPAVVLGLTWRLALCVCSGSSPYLEAGSDTCVSAVVLVLTWRLALTPVCLQLLWALPGGLAVVTMLVVQIEVDELDLHPLPALAVEAVRALLVARVSLREAGTGKGAIDGLMAVEIHITVFVYCKR